MSDFSAYPNFRLLREVDLPELRSRALEFEHLPSGARLLHLANDDSENCFAIAFATPPESSNGVAHILEHAVLAGSKRYPVREPFFELIKSSPAGFINAMTSDVWTIYPICTTLAPDFFNLAEVYADAVFHPLLTRETFEREGHHLELEEPGNLDTALVRSGIVYNEMKGAYSSAETVIAWRLKNRLFPGGALGVDSGGEPKEIPNLTWERLREFYGRFYAPGNCTLLLYGDIPTETQLAYWDEKLSGRGHAPSLAARPVFESWTEPRTWTETFAAEPGSSLDGQTYLSLRWRCGDGLNLFEEVAWHVLSQLLAGHDGAPLKKALIASKLGHDVMAAGVEEVESELVFHVALKGSEPDRAGAFLDLTLGTLGTIAENGFSAEEIETALRQVAYATLEVHNLFPLHVAMNAARYAACGADPIEATRSQAALEEIRAKAADPEFFPNLIRSRLIENPHRLLTTFRPDPEQGAREAAEEAAELAKLRATLTEAELGDIDERAQELNAAQSEPNTPESLALLPRLARRDLPQAPREIPTSIHEIHGFTVLRNDVFSNGVAYVRAAAAINDLPPELWKYIPQYADAFSKLGADGQNWEQIAARRAAVTGDLRAGASRQVHAVTGAPVIDLNFALKSLDTDFADGLELFEDLILRLEPDDLDRLREVGTQAQAHLRDSLVSNALGAATAAASRAVAPAGWLTYLWDSPLTYAWTRHLNENFEEQAGAWVKGIERIRDFLFNGSRWSFSFTGDDAAFAKFSAALARLSEEMAWSTLSTAPPVMGPGKWDGGTDLPKVLGLAAPLEVQFCAKAIPAPPVSEEPLVDLGLRLLNFGYLLPEIRLKGNAYGGGVRLSMAEGTSGFFSYRDPRLAETLEIFEGSRDWVAAQTWSPEDLESALLGNLKSAVPAIRPEDATSRGLKLHRRGDTPEKRAEGYQRRLDAKPDEVQAALLRYLDETRNRGAVAVAASRAALNEANGARAAAGREGLEIREMLPEGAE